MAFSMFISRCCEFGYQSSLFVPMFSRDFQRDPRVNETKSPPFLVAEELQTSSKKSLHLLAVSLKDCNALLFEPVRQIACLSLRHPWLFLPHFSPPCTFAHSLTHSLMTVSRQTPFKGEGDQGVGDQGEEALSQVLGYRNAGMPLRSLSLQVRV